MTSVLNEIEKLRGENNFLIDYKNSNRYRIVLIEPNETRTAYYFASPIYNQQTRKIVDMKFVNNGKNVCSVGSSAKITFCDPVRMENSEGSCHISIGKPIRWISEYKLSCGDGEIYNTTNGFACKLPINNNEVLCFDIEVDKPFVKVRSNDKCFALMSEDFRPFFVVSCIGTVTESGEVVSPVKIAYQKMTDKKFAVSFESCSLTGKWIMFEANMYESKLFQDTTVESKHPKMNNAFGGVGFIGVSNEFGEQWLYSRLDCSKIAELLDKRILKAILHLPKLSSSTTDIDAYKLSSRFCSFGSNWNNKMPLSSCVTSSIGESYINIDLASAISDVYGGFAKSEGIVLKSRNKHAGFSVVSTGDSSLYPQIFEVSYI